MLAYCVVVDDDEYIQVDSYIEYLKKCKKEWENDLYLTKDDILEFLIKGLYKFKVEEKKLVGESISNGENI